MILDNLHSGNIQKHVLLYGVEKYSPSQYLFIDINSLTLSMQDFKGFTRETQHVEETLAEN